MSQESFVQLLQSIADLNERVIKLAQSIEGQTEMTCYSVDQASKILGVSRSKMYDLLRRPDFPVVSVGHRKLIPRRQLEEWLDQQCFQKHNAI